MTIEEFQILSTKTMSTEDIFLDPIEAKILNYVIGIAGESGELLDKFKKIYFHKHPVSDHEIQKELGDILHYIVGLHTLLGFKLSDTMEMNVEKLKRRYPDGFSSEKSINRKE